MRVLACLLLFAAAPVHAQMYKCTEGGRTRYSDKPIADCKSAQASPAKAPPKAASARRGQVSKARVEFDQRCAQLRRERDNVQRMPDSAARDQRMEQLRKSSAACN